MDGEGVGAVNQWVSFLIDHVASSQNLQVQVACVDSAGIRRYLMH